MEFLSFGDLSIENITQRTNDFMELNENIVAIESYLNSKPEILKSLLKFRGESPRNLSNISLWTGREDEKRISR